MRDAGKIADIEIGLKVEIESRDGIKTGIITEILTKRDNSKGIKVKLDSGDTGRIKKIIEDSKPKEKDNKKILSKEQIVDVDDSDLDIQIKDLFFLSNKKYSVTTKFYKPIYCKKIHAELQGIVLFKVKAKNINIAIYKINKFLKKFCATKDIKYKVIKVKDV